MNEQLIEKLEAIKNWHLKMESPDVAIALVEAIAALTSVKSESAEEVLIKHLPHTYLSERLKDKILKAMHDFANNSKAMKWVTVKEILAKYWYENEYEKLDLTNHLLAEESRLKFREWCKLNLPNQ